MQFRWGETDGVTTLSLDEGAIQGPLQACLVFGVGRADETLTVSGITHLIEHLALQPLGGTPYRLNGSVGPVTTRFVAGGRPEHIVEFLRAVSEHLRELPVDRAEAESRVLRIEEERSGGDQLGLDLSYRFGPQGAGLLGWPQHGLKRIGPADVVDWAHTWFTASNAALWMSGPVPPELDLSALPRGEPPARATVNAQPLPPRTWIGANTRFVAISMLSSRRSGTGPAMDVAQQRAMDRLRLRDAICYSVEHFDVPLPDGWSIQTLRADGLADSYQQILDGLVGVIDELAESGPTNEEVERLQHLYGHALDDPRAIVEFMDTVAGRRVLGLPFETLDEVRARVDALTPAELQRDLAEILPTLVATGPLDLGYELPGWSTDGGWSSDRVTGTRYEPLGDREHGTLVVGADGLSWITPDDQARTVRWSEAIACFTWDNGIRTVLGPTGISVVVVPWSWQGGQELTAVVDKQIAEDRRIRLGAGDTQYLPDPEDPESAADVRWLGSVIGVVHDGLRCDLVIDTDGFFLLYSGQLVATPARLAVLRTSGREELLKADARNEWLPQTDIEAFSIAERRFGGFRRVKAVLTIRTTDGRAFEIELITDRHVEIVRNELPKIVKPFTEVG
jgi:hypothetical protein